MSKETKGRKTAVSVPASAQKMRQIIIETDGNIVKVVKNETAGNLELLATLQAVIGFVANAK